MIYHAAQNPAVEISKPKLYAHILLYIASLNGESVMQSEMKGFRLLEQNGLATGPDTFPG
jgi:hypothetical protein